MQIKPFVRQGLSIMIALALLLSAGLPVRAEGKTGNVAARNGSQYASLGDALAAAINSGSPATVTMLQDTTIAGVGERIVIPKDADITLDLHGHTITSEVPAGGTVQNYTVEVQSGGKFNLVDASESKGGGFVHATGAEGTRFLTNSGTLNMSSVRVANFHHGIVDGINDGRYAGSYGVISGCRFVVTAWAMNFGSADGGTVTGCYLHNSQDFAVRVAAGGKLNLVADCEIEGRSGIFVSETGFIDTISDCAITAGEYAIYNSGTIGTITSTSPEKHTAINGHIYNKGAITLMDGAGTSYCHSGCNITNDWGGNIGVIASGEFYSSSTDANIINNSGGYIDAISGGVFNNPEGRSILNRAGGVIGAISGGTFNGGANKQAIMCYGTIRSISGGYFTGSNGVLWVSGSQNEGKLEALTGGYYKNLGSGETIRATTRGVITIPSGYGLSTVPLRPQDLPEDFPPGIGDREGFYHLGETVEISWDIDGTVSTDTFIKGDPVYYPGNEPQRAEEVFCGWVDGVTLYLPDQTLPAATEVVTYTAVFTAAANKYAIILPDCVTDVSGVEEIENIKVATYLMDVVFCLDTSKLPAGYTVNKVTYCAGAGEPEEAVYDGQSRRYTIPGEKINANITVTIDYIVDGLVAFIANDDFKSLPADYKLLVLTVDTKLNAGAYEYAGKAMFYSGAYSDCQAGEHVYLYVVPAAVTGEEALALLEINRAEGASCLELAYDGDVNLDGRLNSTDAVLTYGLYGGYWVDDPDGKVNMRMRLEADVTGDKVVDTSDAQRVLHYIWSK
jgi:hypothetical protein